jgi:hypothetical protein
MAYKIKKQKKNYFIPEPYGLPRELQEKDKFYTKKEEVYNKLMLRRSFRESTPRTREDKLKRALRRRKL